MMSSFRKLRPVLVQLRAIRYNRRLLCSTVDPLPVPEGDSNKKYPEKITRIVGEISKLTLLETAQLNELLKSELNIQDVPMMPAGVMSAAATQLTMKGQWFAVTDHKYLEAWDLFLSSCVVLGLLVFSFRDIVYLCDKVAKQFLAEEEEKKVEEQTEFLVRLVKFADDSKIKVIKEIKSVMEGINLVQAKKFVEELPQIVKQGINKEDATKLKERLEAAGGVVEVV